MRPQPRLVRPPQDGFNEAGAISPRMCSPDTVTKNTDAGFNEAGAISPRMLIIPYGQHYRTHPLQ